MGFEAFIRYLITDNGRGVIEVEGLKVKYTIVIEKDGEQVIDERLASLLEELDNKGSILAAARAIGMPYSRAWESIAKAERILKEQLVETWKGGPGRGGARLTDAGRKILDLYRKARSRLEGITSLREPIEQRAYEADIIIAHSHDPLLDIVLERLKRDGVKVESLCIGSIRALAMLSLGEADVACSHIYDPETNMYNKPYLEKLWIEDPVRIIGYKRQVVLAYRHDLNLRDLGEALKAIASGELSIINRNPGSGTRALFEYLLNKYIQKAHLDSIKGYNNIAYTHEEASRKVAAGVADATLTLRYAAEKYGLNWIHATWEEYECYTTKKHLNTQIIETLASIASSQWFNNIIKTSIGYDTS